MPTELGASAAEIVLMAAINGTQRQADGAANGAESLRLGHQRSQNLSDAVAAGKLLVDPLSEKILGARSVVDQPK